MPQFNKNLRMLGLFLLCMLTACGGGGGSSNQSNATDSFTVNTSSSNDNTSDSDTSDGDTSDGDAESADVSEATEVRVSFTDIQETIFEPHCVLCHNNTTASSDLSLEGTDSFKNLVRVASVENPNLNRVEPGEPESSWLMHKVEGTANVGARMPNGLPPLTDELIEKLRDWIASGTRGAESAGKQLALSEASGYSTFLSPHAKPIVKNSSFVYAANTPANTVDVIDTRDSTLALRINVGIDPVALAVRPDGKEVWVANHISDSVTIIDTDFTSSTFQQVIATLQDIDEISFITNFDEPIGIAFANNSKAYVALSQTNQIAVVDVNKREVIDHLDIRAHEPRAIVTRNERLYVIPFESNNQTQLSGCRTDQGSGIDGDICTFDAVEHAFTNNNVLSLNYDADIIRNTRLPDRDLFIFDTANDRLIQTVNGVGTLLYGITVDSKGNVFVAQTEARNDANGRAGTEGHSLIQMENRAFLNQITHINCQTVICGDPEFINLEPLPPEHPSEGMALATPFGIQISDDDATLIVTAAGSDKVFFVEASTGEILGRLPVGSVPRGIALGSASDAWILNAVGNSISHIDFTDPQSPKTISTISLEDPTPADIKRGRIAYNNANASSTGTFSCESCHPDGHTDQLIWVLETPICDVDGCTQIPPRLTMPVRGLRDTQPYHWDGIPGDPYGGTNTASINTDVGPNCSIDQPEQCTRHLVDGSLATTLCDLTNCAINDEGKSGLLDKTERDDLAKFILNIPFPPAPYRAFNNVLSPSAIEGFFEFSHINDSGGRATGAQTCGACHKMPFLVSTNTPDTGMEAPTWRGAYDRWMITPQARLNIIDLLNIAGIDNRFNERDMWILAGASPDIWEMVIQGSTGQSGAFARQVTLNDASASLSITNQILDALELAAREQAIVLEGEGVQLNPDNNLEAIALSYDSDGYKDQTGLKVYSREELLQAANDNSLVLTLTARMGINTGPNVAPPAIWPIGEIQTQTRNVDIAFLTEQLSLRFNGRHIYSEPSIFINGRRATGSVRCETGTLPNCDQEIIVVELENAPEPGGLHFMQIQNQHGYFSNDMMFFSEQSNLSPRDGNLITSGGSFAAGLDQFDNNWNTIERATNSITESNGEVRINISSIGDEPWHAQISHSVMVLSGQEYTLCYDARSVGGTRRMTSYIDTNLDDYRNLSGGQFEDNLTTAKQTFEHTFTASETDLSGRVSFDFGQSALDVRIDNIGLYEGNQCGTP